MSKHPTITPPQPGQSTHPRHSGACRNPVTEYLNIWTTAQVQKATGRGKRTNSQSIYGIKKLRELILELAVRGKLVAQNPEDEPACKMLERIASEKDRLLKECKIKKQQVLPKMEESAVPFDIPETWEWSRIGDITNYGLTDKVEAADVDSDTWVLELENVEKETSRLLKKVRYNAKPFRSSKNIFLQGDVIYGKLRPYLDKVLVADEDGVCTTELIPFRAYACVTSQFLRLILKSPYFIKYANASTHGMNLPRLGTEKARLALIPVVPEAEQNRIAAKVDELMTLCDQLEQQQTNSTTTHQTLVETLLATLTHPTTGTDGTETNTIEIFFQHFDTLFTTEQSIDQLKQTILQLAVMGKLVPQDPHDEPTDTQIQRIAKEKEHQIESGVIRKPKQLPEICEDETPFALPKSWRWVKFGLIAEFINGDRSKKYPHRSEYVETGVAWINTGHIQPDGTLTTNQMNFITREKFASLGSGKIHAGDLVYCLRGATFGKTSFVSPYQEGAIASSLMIIRPYINELNVFIFKYLTSPFGQAQIFRFDNGSAQPNLSANSVKSYALPLPPVQEQHRIAAKVDELFRYCDALKTRFSSSRTTHVQLANTIVEQAGA